MCRTWNALFGASRFTAQYVRSVGQDVSPGKCVLLSTSKSVRKDMKLCDISGDGKFWKVQLHVRDPGGHLDFTRRARAGTLSTRVRDATIGVVTVGALPLGFQVKLGLVGGKFFPAGLHAAEVFRAALVRVVWSSKMPLGSTPAILSLLDGPEGVDPAFHIIWARFRMMRRYLADCPEEEPRIFRMLDLISRGAQGHGPVYLLLTSAAEVGFAWDGDERGWVRSSPSPQDDDGAYSTFFLLSTVFRLRRLPSHTHTTPPHPTRPLPPTTTTTTMPGSFVFLPSWLRGLFQPEGKR